MKFQNQPFLDDDGIDTETGSKNKLILQDVECQIREQNRESYHFLTVSSSPRDNHRLSAEESINDTSLVYSNSTHNEHQEQISCSSPILDMCDDFHELSILSEAALIDLANLNMQELILAKKLELEEQAAVLADSIMTKTGPNPATLMPNELIILILSYLPVTKLAEFRLVSCNWKSMIRAIFKRQLIQDIHVLTINHDQKYKEFIEKNTISLPQLRHYSNFMRQISLRELSEATWYSAPPGELQTVCECLCILSVNQLPALPTSPDCISSPTPPQTPTIININNRMSWKTIKKIMMNYEFKSWIINLKNTCESIPAKNVKRVESIIMNDDSITYPRLREVSSLGYKLLIFVAAVLQYHNIYWELQSTISAETEALHKMETLYRYAACVRLDDGLIPVKYAYTPTSDC